MKEPEEEAPALPEAEEAPLAEEEAAGETVANALDIYLPQYEDSNSVWIAETDNQMVVRVIDAYFADRAELGMTGEGGAHWFQLQGLKEGSATVKLIYGSPEEEEDPACTLIYHVNVDAAGNVVIWGMEMNPGTQKIYFGSGNG